MSVIEGQNRGAVTGTSQTGIVFDMAGEGDPPVLFVHGWCGDRGFFAPQF